MDNYPTLPSIAFAIYKTQYMKADTIPIIKGRIFDFIHESFTGGSTEMYKPYGKNIFEYDVNSLYPSSMKYNKYPVGNIIQFQGNIDWLYKLDPSFSLDNSYWIGDSDVATIVDLHKPYLQINHLDKNHGLESRRTIAPNGSFSMKINCPEYYNSLKDYNITIYNGFLFKAEDVFSEYITDVSRIKRNSKKGTPMYLISKLLMNSLYGRFAMKPINHITKYIDRDENIFSFLEEFDIIDYIEINRNTILISYAPRNTINPEFEDFKNSIAIASAVTAYSRVFMSKFKDDSCYYTDTDSIFTDKELDPLLVGKELGQFKLEEKFKEIVFLGPKMYAGITENGEYICKIKGLKTKETSVPFDTMKALLQKDSSENLKHTKWNRQTNESTILMQKVGYEIIISNSKRDIIYDNGLAVDTQAFKLSNNF